MAKKFLIYYWLTLTAVPVTAQEIRGIVLDSIKHQPLNAATVLLVLMDSSVIDRTATGKSGLFRLDLPVQERFLLSIRYLGYHPYYKQLASSSAPFIQPDTIFLLPLAQQLQGVNVLAQRPPAIEHRIDGLVYNPQGDLVAAGSNAQDLLQRVPYVTIGQDGSISIRGSGSVKIFINNKPSEFYANNVSDLLKQLSADDIAKVEVITHPSARYDAEGVAGVLNITLKKNRLRGLTGIFNAEAGPLSQTVDQKFNYRYAKFSASANIFLNRNHTYNDETSDRRGLNNFSSRQFLSTISDGKSNFFSLNGGWEPDSTQTLDVNLRYGRFPVERTQELDVNQPTREYLRKTNRDGIYTVKSASFSYNKRLQQGRELFLLGGYSLRENGGSYLLRQIEHGKQNYQEQNENNSTNYDLIFQADYTHPLRKQNKIETGIKYARRGIYADYDIFIFDSIAGIERDPARSFSYRFHQTVLAGYVSYLVVLNKWTLRSGLRYEYTALDARQRGQVVTLHPYSILAPNIILSRTIREKLVATLSYSRRIQRPEVYQLTPAVDYSDSTNITEGNPDLIPERINRFELSLSTTFNHNSSFLVSIYHAYTNNSIQSMRMMKSPGVIYNTFANIAGATQTGVALNTSLNIGSRVKLNVNGNVFNASFRSDTLSSMRIYIKTSATAVCQLKKGWGLEAGGYWESRSPLFYGYIIGWRNYYVGVNKKLWGERAAISLRLQNFLNKYYIARGVFADNVYTEDIARKFQIPWFRLGLMYKFGKAFNTRPERTRRNVEGL